MIKLIESGIHYRDFYVEDVGDDTRDLAMFEVFYQVQDLINFEVTNQILDGLLKKIYTP